jgi:hypothetical protein
MRKHAQRLTGAISFLEEVKNAALGLNFSYHRASSRAFWIHGYGCCRGWDRKILVLPVPGGLPDLFCYRHIVR